MLRILSAILTLGLYLPANAATTIMVDGSSTVYPLTEAMAEEFGKSHPDVRVTVGISGTGGGFKKFTVGEIDLVDASREITPQEIQTAKKNKIEFIQVPVAMDGITLVVNPKNTWVDHLTVAELKKIWSPESKVKTWKDVRPNWPDKPITLYGPGTDSGTFDFFTEAINGKSRASRSDYTRSEDDNILVHGVEGDEGALGYFGYSYYVSNKKSLKAVPVKDKKVVSPSEKTILDASYSPLSRPLFIYINKPKLNRAEIKDFVRFYLAEAAKLSSEIGFVPLPDQKYKNALGALNIRN